jgi:hypothetical protein
MQTILFLLFIIAINIFVGVYITLTKRHRAYKIGMRKDRKHIKSLGR